MALSVGTPQHLNKIGLLPDYKPNDEQDINYLYKTALEKIAFLPYGYLIDQWRWMAFDKSIDITNWNDKYWDLRYKYQGVVPPVPRSSSDFDPGAKFHVPSNTPYIRYFVAFVSEFQFYESMCNASGQLDNNRPLYQCDFYKSPEAGNTIKKLLELGSSVPWPEALKRMTGKDKLDVSSITKYFEKLTKWLKEKNQGSCYGWGFTWPEDVMKKLNHNRCPQNFGGYDVYIADWLTKYNKDAGEVYNKAVWAMWNYGKNVTEATQEASDEEATKRSLFDQEKSLEAKSLTLANVSDPLAVREIGKIAGGGLVLNADETKRRANLVSTMSGRFDTGKICTYDLRNGCDLNNKTQYWNQDPNLDTLFATSRDYDVLSYAWKGWRDATGKLNLHDYQEYIDLSNKGARAAGFDDCGDYWRSSYETPTFQEDLEALWKEVLPLYEQLHAYVRRRLSQTYPKRFEPTSTIPAHLLGNIWAQEWDNLYSISAPYPDSTDVDVTAAMVAQNYDAMRMFRTAEAFYKSIGLLPMTDEFWNDSMLVRPADGHEVDCYADSEDFYNGKDFGIKMCTKITMSDLVIAKWLN